MINNTKIKTDPFIKWAGGKQSTLNQLIPNFPKQYNRYFEPFIGGGAVFFATNHQNSVIADQNKWLIDTYEAIRSNWRDVADILDRLPNTKEDYLRIRSISPSSLDLVTRAAHLIYLNKTCFRGLFRVNRSGKFNVPYGEYDRRYYDPVNLQSASLALAGATILCGDFEQALVGAEEGDFVYFDPPYYKLGGYSDFNRYTAGQFSESDHFRLASLCHKLTDRGVKWALSNSDTQFVRNLFGQYRLTTIKSRREINLNSQDRNITELLFLNY